MVFAIIHSVEPLEEFSQFITDVIKAEDEDLKVRPQFIQCSDKMMGIFCNFVDGGEFGLDVELYERLYVLPDEFVDLHFVASGRLFG